MNVVLYTDSMEAITILDVPVDFATGRSFDVFRVAVTRPVSFKWDVSFADLESMNYDVVTIRLEWLQRNGKRHPLFITDDDELALLLRSSTLPGQRRAFHDAFERGFIEGLAVAMR